MNNLSYLEKLLDGAEVEWKTLREVAEIFDSLHQTPQYSEAGLSMVRVTDIKGGVLNLDGTLKVNNEVFKIFTKKYLPKKFDLVMSRVGSYGNVGIIPSNNSVCMGQNTVVIHPLINSKYLFHILLSKAVQSFIEQNVGGGNQKTLSLTSIQKIPIPIPIPSPNNPEKSLAIQSGIVRILDAFTQLTAELTAELTARKKQYDYYRNQLLTFKDGDVEWKALGKLGQLIRGNGLPKTDFTEMGVPAIHYGQIYTYYGLFTIKTKSFVSHETAKKLRKVDTGDVVITNTSENLEDVGKALVYLGKEQAVTGGHATIFKPGKIITGKYFTYFTQTIEFANQKRKLAKGTKVIDVSATDLAKISIPIPCPNNPEKSLAEQARIVSILDKFDALINSLTEGLPREIELRQKQYEYYRDLLLSFPKAAERAIR